MIRVRALFGVTIFNRHRHPSTEELLLYPTIVWLKIPTIAFYHTGAFGVKYV